MTTYLVTGAGGHLGRLAAETLLDAKAGKVIAATRDPCEAQRARHHAAPNCAAPISTIPHRSPPPSPVSIACSSSRPTRSTSPAAASPSIATPSPPPPRLASSTSSILRRPMRGRLGRSGILDDHYWSEQALAASGLDWTILRNHIYAEISLMGLPHALATGKLLHRDGFGRPLLCHARRLRPRSPPARSPKATGSRIFDVTGPKPDHPERARRNSSVH